LAHGVLRWLGAGLTCQSTRTPKCVRALRAHLALVAGHLYVNCHCMENMGALEMLAVAADPVVIGALGVRAVFARRSRRNPIPGCARACELGGTTGAIGFSAVGAQAPVARGAAKAFAELFGAAADLRSGSAMQGPFTGRHSLRRWPGRRAYVVGAGHGAPVNKPVKTDAQGRPAAARPLFLGRRLLLRYEAWL